eukprot:scaffold1200_cov146-Pinguiococcus_pyrenoidosus.AAC.1
MAVDRRVDRERLDADELTLPAGEHSRMRRDEKDLSVVHLRKQPANRGLERGQHAISGGQKAVLIRDVAHLLPIPGPVIQAFCSRQEALRIATHGQVEESARQATNAVG